MTVARLINSLFLYSSVSSNSVWPIRIMYFWHLNRKQVGLSFFFRVEVLKRLKLKTKRRRIGSEISYLQELTTFFDGNKRKFMGVVHAHNLVIE